MDVLARAGAFVLVFFGALGIVASSRGVASTTFVVDFGSTALLDKSASSGVFWDTAGKRLRAPIVANGAPLDFGDGSDGVFSDGPTQTGITASGSAISINTDVKATFNFTSFKLSQGNTITATGAKPLVIRVTGSAAVAGTVNLSGGTGTINNLTRTLPAGGSAGAGGGAGGAAGFGSPTFPPVTPALSGLPTVGNIALGGFFGSNASNSNNGGGGGCNGINGATNGLASSGGSAGATGACTLSPATIANSFETNLQINFTGGGGGGGGGGFTASLGADASGSGGGGGGGAILISALGSITFGTSSPWGNFQANGGDGGENTFNHNGSDCGGGGGGGSGGTVWLQSPSGVGDLSNQATIQVSAGSGGTDGGACAGLADGGNGSLGVFRLDAPDANGVTGAALSTPLKVPSVAANQTYTLTSKPIDAGASTTSYATPTESIDTTSTGCGAGTLTVQYEGSNDGTNFSGDVTKDQITILDGYRYIRFKTTITTSASGTSPCLTGLSIPYGSNQFEIKGGLACGSLQSGSGPRSGGGKKKGSPFGAAADLALIGLAALAALRPWKRLT